MKALKEAAFNLAVCVALIQFVALFLGTAEGFTNRACDRWPSMRISYTVPAWPVGCRVVRWLTEKPSG